jgi:hypothetical protein
MNYPLPSPRPRSIEGRLAELGLTPDIFDRAGREHLAAYFGCDPHYPRIFRPISAWAEGNHSIRHSLAPRWEAKDENNQPLAINEDGSIAITALSGDQRTGTDEIPSTRSPKGKKTAEAVEANSSQAEFEFVAEQRAAAVAQAVKVPGRQLWIFLTFRDFEKGELRSELSCPKEIGDDGYIESWWERIIFPPISFDRGSVDIGSQDNPSSGNDDGGQSPEITVYIPRRSS